MATERNVERGRGLLLAQINLVAAQGGDVSLPMHFDGDLSGPAKEKHAHALPDLICKRLSVGAMQMMT